MKINLQKQCAKRNSETPKIDSKRNNGTPKINSKREQRDTESRFQSPTNQDMNKLMAINSEQNDENNEGLNELTNSPLIRNLSEVSGGIE